MHKLQSGFITMEESGRGCVVWEAAAKW